MLLQKNLKKKFLFTIVATMMVVSSYAATITSTTSGGNWSATGTWSGGVVPGAGDDVVIDGNVDMDNDFTCVNLTINSGKQLILHDPKVLTVAGNWINDGGTLSTSGSNPADIKMTGNGATIGGTGSTTFSNLIIDPGAGKTVSVITDMKIRNGGKLTLNTGIFKVGPTNTITILSGGNTTVKGVNGNFAYSGDGQSHTDADGGKIIMEGNSGNEIIADNSATNTTGFLRFYDVFSGPTTDGNWRFTVTNASTVEINGTLKVTQASGSNQFAVKSNPPIWGPSSSFYLDKNGLEYKQSDDKAWTANSGTIGVTPGYPNNVQLVNMGTSAGNPAIVPYGNINTGWRPASTDDIGLNGILHIGDGTTAGVVGFDRANSVTVGGLIIDNGSGVISTAAGKTFTDKGDFILKGATTGIFYNNGNSTMTFGGTGTQNVSTTGASITFPNMTVNGGVNDNIILQDDVFVSSILTMTQGVVTTSATNSLTVLNPAIGGISGGGTNSFVDGPLIWNFTAASSGNYLFPVGELSPTKTYLPLTLGITAGTAAAVNTTVEAFATNSAGIPDATISALSTTEYWSVSTSTPFTGSPTVSVSRPAAVTPTYNSLGESVTTSNGRYTAIGGSASGGSVTGAGLGTNSPVYLAIVNAFLNVVKVSSVNAGVNSACSPIGGSLTVGGVGGTAPYTYSMDGSGFTSTTTYTGLAVGNHTVIVKDASTATKTRVLKVLGPLVINGNNADVSLCAPQTPTLTASNALNGSATYSWTRAASGATVIGTSSTLVVNAADDYYVTSDVLIAGATNLIGNGSFETGSGSAAVASGMTVNTGYTYNSGSYGTTPGNNGYWQITTAGNTLCTFFTSLTAQSGTKYMVIDGSIAASTVYDIALTGLTVGKSYTYSFWYAQGSNHGNRAVLQTNITAGGSITSGTNNLTVSNYTGWLQASYTILASSANMTINLRDTYAPGTTDGDDFYIDNVELYPLNVCTIKDTVKVIVDCSLPVDLLKFNAVKQGAGAIVTWATVSEKNSGYFIVQRSTDGLNFYPVGRVEAAGNSSSIENYSFVDPTIATGITYYRLEEHDIDGAVQYTEIKAVSKDGLSGVQVTPNPNNGVFVVTFDNPGEAKSRVSVLNSLGQIVYTSPETETNFKNVDISALASGVYYLQVNTSDERVVKKIVKE